MNPEKSFLPIRTLAVLCALAAAPAGTSRAQDAGAPPADATPPRSWIDPDTGHRVIRLTNEPGSDSFYFNVNPYTPDGKEMAYTTADGSIGMVNLANFETRIVVKGPVRAVVVGHRTPTVDHHARNHPPEGGRYTYMVAGRTCLAGDIFGTYQFAEKLQAGSLIPFADAAGYTMVKKNWFNGVPMPSIVVRRLDGRVEKVKTVRLRRLPQQLVLRRDWE